MTTDQEYTANKGRREPFDGILSQADHSIGLGVEHQAKVGPLGFTEAKVQEMRDRRAEMIALYATQSEAKASAKAATRNEVSASSLSKEYLRKLSLMAPTAIEAIKPAGMTVDDLAPEKALGRSSTRMAAHFDRIRPFVAKIEEGLRPAFGGESPLAIHDRLRAELSAAAETQLTQLDKLPEKTLKLHLAKGRLLELIEELNRLGRLAYMDQPEIAARFNKDILLRARRRGGDTGEPANTTTTVTGTP